MLVINTRIYGSTNNLRTHKTAIKSDKWFKIFFTNFSKIYETMDSKTEKKKNCN